MLAPIIPRSGCILVLSFVFLAIFSLFTPEKTSASNHIIYVNAAATGDDDGTSWANAFTDLQGALTAAGNGDEIWVVAGTYKPGIDRGHTFQLQNGVAIYGGFAGTELGREAREWQTNVTILSGDINNSGDSNGNSYHVVTGSGTDASAILDGFTITAGNTTGTPTPNGGGMHNNSGSPTVANVIFSGNITSSTSGDGGGMYNANGSNPTLTNVTFNDNHAAQGGGMFNTNSSPILTNVTFSGNSASLDGGAMNNFSSSPILTNVTFSNNSASIDGGAIRNWNGSNPTLINVIFSGNQAGFSGGGVANHFNSSPILTNVTFSGNQAVSGGGGMHNTSNSDPAIQNSIFWNNSSSIVTDSTGAIIRYSLVEGLNPAGEDNLDGTDPGNDPLFIDMLTGDLRLQSGSPVIDAGNDSFLPSEVTTDLGGNPRFVDIPGVDNSPTGVVDLGAYEVPLVRFYVDGAAGGANNGSSWADAFNDLQDALTSATSVTPATAVEIWVAAGIYKPGSDHTHTFQLQNGVAIFGGFAATETELAARDWQTNITVLSGDINDSSDSDGNSYHVVTGSDTNASAILDGFTITAGNADGDFISPCGQWCGGGMYNVSGSPTIANVTFSGNNASFFGGGMANYSGSNPILINVIFNGNNAQTGGGGMVNAGGSRPTLTDVLFSANNGDLGGGMHNVGASHAILTAVTFMDNTALSGGGLYNDGSHPNLTNVIFSNNTTAGGGGGALYNSNSSPIVFNTVFTGNTTAASGGGIYNSGSSNPELTNIIVSGNHAANHGGGIYNTGSASPILTNVTVSGNHAVNDGGGMFNFSSGSSPLVQNSIFWNNQATASDSIFDNNSSLIVRYSLVEGCNPDGTWLANCGTDDNNNLPDVDPLFVDAPTPAGNLRLQAGSPAIDAGNATLVPAGVATDLDGLSRIIGSAVDMGAYESQYEQVCGGFTAGIPYVIGTSQPITLTFTDPGTVNCVAVTYFPTDHLETTEEAANLATGHYWTIAAAGSGFTAVLALPHDNLSDPKACRWLEGTGPGAGWDCARHDFTNSNVIRHDITQFSDWAVGNEVGPTAITLQSLTAVQSGKVLPVNLSLLLLLLLVIATTGLMLYRNTAQRPLRHRRDGQAGIDA